MKNIYRYTSVIFLITLLVSCNKFLEEAPTKSAAIEPKSLADFEALLNNYNRFYSEFVNPIIFGTDDYELSTDLFDASSKLYQTDVAIYGTWNMKLAANQGARYSGWPGEWKKIFTANLILEKIDGVNATQEEKENIKAECHFIRVYSYFLLATTYCLPYSEANKGEVGLPIKRTISFEESIERATLKETYDYMKADLDKALKISRSLGQVNKLNSSWRANKAAVNGFAARFYLALNAYPKAQSYAQNALNAHNILRDYNTGMRFSNIPSKATIFNPKPTPVDILYPYTHDQQILAKDRLAFGEFYYYRMLDNPHWAYWPSKKLLSLYDQTNDLRYKFHMVENYSYVRGAVKPSFSYPGYIFFFKSDIPSGPSVPEMLLIKAECQVRQGMWGEGIQTANILRVARMNANAPDAIYLSANSQAEALTKVLEERRREMPFVHRWYDIRRYNNNQDPSDDVILSRTFYPFNANVIFNNQAPIRTTLDKNSRKFAYPIPNEEILISNGALKQNKY